MSNSRCSVPLVPALVKMAVVSKTTGSRREASPLARGRKNGSHIAQVCFACKARGFQIREGETSRIMKSHFTGPRYRSSQSKISLIMRSFEGACPDSTST